MEGSIKVVIADSSSLARVGLNKVLKDAGSITIAGEATSIKELIALLSTCQADVVLIDFTSKGFSIESVAQVSQEYPSVRIVAITPDQDGLTLINALKAGVTSYIKKDCDLDEIVSSVRQTADGSKFFCGQILDTIEAVKIDVEGQEWPHSNCAPVHFSARELEIITLIAEGHTNSEIADMLFLSPHTVNTHRKNIMQKLGVNNTASIVMYAVKAHLVNVNRFLFSSR